ncbi:MAG: glycosyltransferase family A protein [bacterium]
MKGADALGAYLRRHALHPPLIQAPPHPRLGLVVVIPSHDEPELTAALDGLWACRRPECAVEVIVAINRSDDAPRDLARRHEAQVAGAREWAAGHPEARMRFYMLDFPGLPKRHAGVGLARKLGMDEAIARLAAAGNGSAPIACLDADCRVAPDYLTALERHFTVHPDTPACSLHFEHDWKHGFTGTAGRREREGIVQYELHLRCVVAGLRLAGHPHAFHTVGSAMAVRADVYARQGGMNRRKGAEDFYFLAKLMPLGGFSVLTGTTVIPSGRSSHRVPFGTGRTMTDWMGGRNPAFPTAFPTAITTNAPESYRSLGRLLEGLPGLHGSGAAGLSTFFSNQDAVMAGFLETAGFPGRLAEIRNNTASPATFYDRMMRWWDRFRVLKWMHFARDRAWPDVPAEQAAAELLAWDGRSVPSGDGVSKQGFSRRVALLERFRELERRG